MWYIYQYFDGLKESLEALIFINRWVLDHEPIDKDSDESKFRLNDVIHDYEAKCTNLFNGIQKDTNVAPLTTELTVIDLKQKPAQPKITDFAHSKVVIQTVKWCTHCQKTYYIDAECHILYSHLKAVADKRKAEKKKRREKSNEQHQSKKNKNKEDKSKKNSWGVTDAIVIRIHLAFANVAFFKSINSKPIIQIGASAIPVKIMNFLVAWLLDTKALYHITHDRSFLSNFKAILNTSIGKIKKQLTSSDYKIVRLLCRTSTGGRSLKIHNVLYVLDC